MKRSCPVALLRLLALATLLLPAPSAAARELVTGTPDSLCLSVRNTEIAEVFEMLSRAQRANILLTKDVNGPVSVHLFDVDFDTAVRAVAQASNYAVEVRDGTYVILKSEEVGRDVPGAVTEIRSFKVQYTDSKLTADILEKHLSRYGQITVLEDRDLLVIQDLPGFMLQLEGLLREIDVQPKQVLIEAKVLEISLNDSEAFGFDWRRLFRAEGGEGSFGTRGLSKAISQGLFFEFANRNLEVALDALAERGRVRTLSTPKLLALENQEASVIIGQEQGYTVTTTINQVTSESVEFLESGVILRVTPSVDNQGRVLLEVHPEVSTGSVDDEGIPAKSTTAVTTMMLAEDGQTIFIGGLMKNQVTQGRAGVPVLGSIPFLGRFFSRTEDQSVNTETVVLITPRIVTEDLWEKFGAEDERVDRVALDLRERMVEIDQVATQTKRIEETLGIPGRQTVPADDLSMDP